MTDWLERAQSEIQESSGQGAANAAERPLTAATAAPHLGKSGISNSSNGTSPTDTAAAALWWRVSIFEPGGRTIEVDAPSGWTLPDWQAYAARYHGPGCTVTPIAGLPEPSGAGQPR
jgi:hypothetical protein